MHDSCGPMLGRVSSSLGSAWYVTAPSATSSTAHNWIERQSCRHLGSLTTGDAQLQSAEMGARAG